ncbi:MAG: hypothetical protein CME21_21620 [Gemmatimonadetes bacterium]|nr:hypothetical protein [Gemmatimonadota bacterium]
MRAEEIELQVATIRMALDDDSPFKGMIDLRGLDSLSAEDAHEVWEAMGEELQEKFNATYLREDQTQTTPNDLP